MTNTVEVETDGLDAEIEEYKRRGYRVEMIVPADSPREAMLSREGEAVRLVLENHNVGQKPPPILGNEGSWIRGRAGMEYRDLIPDRLGGKVIASQIRLTKAGAVPDYVHYHKVDFQMIYCKRGRIKIVYEDQGEPFWLETGDCILQPPEIRHRVLECAAGAEVVEVSMPAEHETWVEHAITLPNGRSLPEREFNGQRFVRHIAAETGWRMDDEKSLLYQETGIFEATKGLARVSVVRSSDGNKDVTVVEDDESYSLAFPLDDGRRLDLRIFRDKITTSD